jgi:hypothetical protein
MKEARECSGCGLQNDGRQNDKKRSVHRFGEVVAFAASSVSSLNLSRFLRAKYADIK